MDDHLYVLGKAMAAQNPVGLVDRQDAARIVNDEGFYPTQQAVDSFLRGWTVGGGRPPLEPLE